MMTEKYKLIPEISPTQKNWQAKVIVAEKLAPKQARNSNSILAVAIDMRPKRLIQTRYGNQTYVQDDVLIDRNFYTIILTMWDAYVEKECIILAEKIAKKPVILANRLKVSSFNGLTLSTKINSTFFMDAAFNQVAEFRAWVEAHTEELNEITLEKPCLTVTPTKLSPPAHKKFMLIQNMKGRLLGRKYFWIKAKATITAGKQTFWYMSCSNCNRVSHADFGETFQCIYCKYPSSKAGPRANATVQLEDASGILIASAIGSPAETLLKCNAETLMKHSHLGSDANIAEFIPMDAQEHIFYVKVTQLEPNTVEYKYEIVFVLDACTITDGPEESLEKDSSLPCLAEVEKNCDNQDISQPSAKRSLFYTSTEPDFPKKNTGIKIPASSSRKDQVIEKGKLD